jgi:hypothetical protein
MEFWRGGTHGWSWRIPESPISRLYYIPRYILQIVIFKYDQSLLLAKVHMLGEMIIS